MHTARPRWNHNIHYHRLVLDAIPDGARTALDVGCGEGILARELRERVPAVTAIDLDRPSIELARRSGSDVDYLLGDVMTHPLPVASFDLVASVATLHHLNARAGLRRLADLVKPGGRLIVIGLARRSARDLPLDVLSAVVNKVYERRRGYWEHSAPIVWPPPETTAGMRRIAHEVLPGARHRRHLFWRYSILWTKPVENHHVVPTSSSERRQAPIRAQGDKL